MAGTKEAVAHWTVRVCWLISFCLLWIGLFAKGWYHFEFEGKADSETPAFREDYEAHYGLFGIQYETPTGEHVVSYNGWARATSKYPEPFLRVHGSRVSAVIAAIACILTALSYYRTSISKAETQLFSTARMAWLAALDLALNLTTLGLWAMLNGDLAFNTVCEKSGCFPVPPEQVTKSSIDYNWGIWFVRAVLQCLIVGAACYLARERRSNVAFRTPKSADGNGIHPSAPELEASPTMKSAV